MKSDPIVIVSAQRTAMGGFQGALSSETAPKLGAHAVRAVLDDSGLSADEVDELLMGHVLSAGVGQAPTRQAALQAGLSHTTECSGVSKVCGSGMKALMNAQDTLSVGRQKVMIAGGMESMSNAPYLLDKARSGYRLGHAQTKDHMFLDGLEDAYFDQGTLMGVFAELNAAHYQFTREDQDRFALRSLERSLAAIEAGAFANEIAPYTVKGRRGDVLVEYDESPSQARPDKIPSLRPAFAKDGTVTAANASSISDGAAALLMMPLSEAERRGLTPLAKITGQASYSGEPKWFTTAPVFAMRKLSEQLNIPVTDFDLYEVNEAFAVVTMAAIKELDLNDEKVNIHGGACALGHPIGASGARIVVTLLHALQRHGLKTGMASLCIGGGEATAIALEML